MIGPRLRLVAGMVWLMLRLAAPWVAAAAAAVWLDRVKI